ncbi:MAG: hypothetical protein ACR2QO_05730 [Acidimicrobiales bacterium]
MDHRLWIRIVLGYLALVSIQIGAWALFAPRSFYDGFPGLGLAWVSVDGPYNEHLIRDVGALNLALVVLFIAAAASLSRPLILTAAAAAMVWGVPHLVYHLVNTDGLSSSDLALSLGGLVLFAGLPIALIIVTKRGLGMSQREA